MATTGPPLKRLTHPPTTAPWLSPQDVTGLVRNHAAAPGRVPISKSNPHGRWVFPHAPARVGLARTSLARETLKARLTQWQPSFCSKHFQKLRIFGGAQFPRTPRCVGPNSRRLPPSTHPHNSARAFNQTNMGRRVWRMPCVFVLALFLGLAAGGSDDDAGVGGVASSTSTSENDYQQKAEPSPPLATITTTAPAAAAAAAAALPPLPLPGLWWFAPVLSGGGYCTEAGP